MGSVHTQLRLPPVAIVAGDFVKTGGMDRANYALAQHLASLGVDLELVGYRASPELCGLPNVKFHQAPKPLGSYSLGAPILSLLGQYVATKMRQRGGIVVGNGGNLAGADFNWVHYVHAAWLPTDAQRGLRHLKSQADHLLARLSERAALKSARRIIVNSERTRRDVQRLVGEGELRPIKTIYCGTDAQQFRPATLAEKRVSRSKYAADAQGLALFVGGLGNRRKGFDTLFQAWTRLEQDPIWDVKLLVVGQGPELKNWQEQARRLQRPLIEFLGFRQDVAELLRAADLLISPTRYEAYGLGVREALASGVPAIVSAAAGVAEHYPAGLRQLLLDDPESVDELVAKLRRWYAQVPAFTEQFQPLSSIIRAHSWEAMAQQFVEYFAEYLAERRP